VSPAQNGEINSTNELMKNMFAKKKQSFSYKNISESAIIVIS